VIVIGTSALMAILQQEPEAERFIETIGLSDRVVLGAPTAFEFRLVTLRQKGPGYLPAADRVLGFGTIEIVAWSNQHQLIATEALQRFGGRPARLNLGGCMAYAVAKALDAPLLYKGNDFAHTDIRSALT
jgi:ribonuclease VapC